MPVLNSANLQRQLKRIATDERWAKEGLRSLAFEVKDAVARDVTKAFTLTNRGRTLLSKGWRLRYQTAGSRFVAWIYPLDRTARVLAKHAERTAVQPTDGQNLTVGGDIAVPVGVRKGGTGRVRKTETPASLLTPRGKKNTTRGFISKDGRSLMKRIRGGAPTLAYALVSKVIEPKRIDPEESAGRAVNREAGRAFARAWRKLMRRT